MHKTLSAVLSLALVLALGIPAAAQQQSTPVSGALTYYLVSQGDTCGYLSLTKKDRGAPTDGCGSPFYGLLEPTARPRLRRMTHLAEEGLPFTLDASRLIAGSVTVRSYLVVGIARRDAAGVGQPILEVKLLGSVEGEEVTIGEFVSDPYTITPAARDYSVNFRMRPNASLSGKVIESLKLKLKTGGRSLFHGFYPANGTTHLTLGTLQES